MNSINSEDIIKEGNHTLYDFVKSNIKRIPDFYGILEAKERWSDINRESVIWTALYRELYRELSGLNDHTDIVEILNSRIRASKFPRERLREFIEKFRTLFRILVAVVCNIFDNRESYEGGKTFSLIKWTPSLDNNSSSYVVDTT